MHTFPYSSPFFPLLHFWYAFLFHLFPSLQITPVKSPFSLIGCCTYIDRRSNKWASYSEGNETRQQVACECNMGNQVQQSALWTQEIQRVGRGIALLFHERGTRRGVRGQLHAPAALYSRERPGTHLAGGWVGPRACLDGRKISSPREFDPGPSSP